MKERVRQGIEFGRALIADFFYIERIISFDQGFFTCILKFLIDNIESNFKSLYRLLKIKISHLTIPENGSNNGQYETLEGVNKVINKYWSRINQLWVVFEEDDNKDKLFNFSKYDTTSNDIPNVISDFFFIWSLLL